MWETNWGRYLWSCENTQLPWANSSFTSSHRGTQNSTWIKVKQATLHQLPIFHSFFFPGLTSSFSFFYSSYRELPSHIFLLYSFHNIPSMWRIPTSGWPLEEAFILFLAWVSISCLRVTTGTTSPNGHNADKRGWQRARQKPKDAWNQPGSRDSSYPHGRILVSERWAKN